MNAHYPYDEEVGAMTRGLRLEGVDIEEVGSRCLTVSGYHQDFPDIKSKWWFLVGYTLRIQQEEKQDDNRDN
jgi:hypothetical protein